MRGAHFVKGILVSFNMVPRVSIFLSFATYVYCGNIFTAKQVFIVTTYFNYLYNSMLHSWAEALTSLAECYVSINRIENFLLEPESKLDACMKNGTVQEDDSLLKQSSRNQLEMVDNLNTSLKSMGSSMRLQYVNQRRSQVNEPNGKRGVIFDRVTALWPGHDDRCNMGKCIFVGTSAYKCENYAVFFHPQASKMSV